MTKHSETGYALRGGMPESYRVQVVDRMLRRIGPPKSNKRVLDAYAGRGGVGFYIAEHGYPVTLLDYNPIAFNNETVERARSLNVRLTANSIENYARENSASVYALHAKDPWDGRVGMYVDNVIGFIATLQDLLKPDGHLLVSSYHLFGYLKTYFLVKQMGFNRVNVSTWKPDLSEVKNDWYKDEKAVKRYVFSCVK